MTTKTRHLQIPAHLNDGTETAFTPETLRSKSTVLPSMLATATEKLKHGDIITLMVVDLTDEEVAALPDA